MMCVVCSCCVSSPYREMCRARRNRDGETLCHAVYPALPITTVSLATNTYCMMDGHSSCTARTVGPRCELWTEQLMTGQAYSIHLLSVVQAAMIAQYRVQQNQFLVILVHLRCFVVICLTFFFVVNTVLCFLVWSLSVCLSTEEVSVTVLVFPVLYILAYFIR